MMKPMQAPGTKMVRSKDIAALMTCPICVKIQRNATTISECLHTFCKKCITKLIVEEDLKNCPVCNTDLGCSPLEKLRPDHNMQSLVEKIFSSFKKSAKDQPESSERKIEPPQIGAEENEESNMPSIQHPKPSRRKERSLSSLVTAPKVSNESLTTGRRKSIPVKSPNSVYNEDPISKVDDYPESSRSPTALKKVARNKKQISTTQSSEQPLPNKGKRQSEPLDGMGDLWKPLNCLVEAADATKAGKSSSVGIVFKSPPPPIIHQDKANFPKGKGKGKECMADTTKAGKSSAVGIVFKPPIIHQDKANFPKGKGKGKECMDILVEAADTTKAGKSSSVGIVFKPPIIHQDKPNFPKGKGKGKECMNISSTRNNSDDDEEEEDHRETLVPSVPVKLKRTPRGGGKQKREVTSQEGLRLVSPQDVVDAASHNKCEKRITSIWLSLVASCNQEGALSLPQIPSCYLRIKDIHVPILFIKKYIARKLELDSENEVEIALHGHPLPSNLELRNVLDLWSQTMSSSENRITTSVGSSAKDFVMVLSYSRKINLAL